MDPLATPGELSTHLQREVDVSAATLALTLASGAVRAYCGWDLAREDTTLVAYGDGSPVLSLPTLDLRDVTNVRVDGEELDLTLTGLTVGRVVWSRKGQLFRGIGWPRHLTIEADVTHGYDPIPDIVKLIVLERAARQLANPEQLMSATVSSVSKTWASGTGSVSLSSLDERLLDRYRL